MAQVNITLDTELLHGLFVKETKDGAFSKLLETILNQVLVSQSTEQLGAEQLQAEPYERSQDRTAYRNGFLRTGDDYKDRKDNPESAKTQERRVQYRAVYKISEE